MVSRVPDFSHIGRTVCRIRRAADVRSDHGTRSAPLSPEIGPAGRLQILTTEHWSLLATRSRAGLPHQRFHDMRHAYATLMIEDGEELAVISKTLGHSNISTTADVYAHLTPAMLERSANRMDGILRMKA